MQTGVDSWEARSDLVRRKDNLLKQPSALALWPGSVQSPNCVCSLPMLCVAMPQLSQVLQTGFPLHSLIGVEGRFYRDKDPLMLDSNAMR